MPDPRLATLLPSDRGRMYTHPLTREQHVSSTTVLKTLAKKLDRWHGAEAVGAAWDQRDWLMTLTREQAIDAFASASNRTRDAAGDHGRFVHRGCELLAMSAAGWSLTPDQQRELAVLLSGAQGALVQQGIFRFAEWAKAYVAEWLHLEQTVWGNGWAGTFDWLTRLIDGRICLVDGKSNKAIYREPKLQLASYKFAPIMLNADGVETPMPDIDVCAVLWLPQAGGYTMLDLEVNQRDLEVFEHLLEVWYWTEETPPNPGVVIPVATAPGVPGARQCGNARKGGSISCITMLDENGKHKGDHHGKSKTGSRNYYWANEDAPEPGAATADESPPALALVPEVPSAPAGLPPGATVPPGPERSAPDVPELSEPSPESVVAQVAPPGLQPASRPRGGQPVRVGLGLDLPGPTESLPPAPAAILYEDIPVGQLTDAQYEEVYRALAAQGALPNPRFSDPVEEARDVVTSGVWAMTRDESGNPLDEAEAYSARIARMFLEPGGGS